MMRNRRRIGLVQGILLTMLAVTSTVSPLRLAAEEASPPDGAAVQTESVQPQPAASGPEQQAPGPGQPSGMNAAPGAPAPAQAPEISADRNAPATGQKTPVKTPQPEQTAPSPVPGTGEARKEPAPGRTEAGGENIQAGETLTLNRCIAIANKKNPGIVAAENTVDVNRSRVGVARSAYYPSVSASAGYSRTKLEKEITAHEDGKNTTTITPTTGAYSGTIGLDQTIYDFGRTSSSVDISKYILEASRSDLDASRNTILLNVKQAYYGVLQAQRNRDVAADVIKQFQLHLDQAKGFYEVGTKARIDVIKAEVDLSNAKLALINAENALKIAWITLNNAMGIPDAPEYSIEDNLSFQPYEVPLDEATAKALDNRPELRSIIAKRQAAERNVSLQRSGYLPILSGNANYTRSQSEVVDTPVETNYSQSWDAGVMLTVPLFSGFLTRHQVAEAKANLYVLRANEESLRQQVLLDVRQAYLNLQAAAASISTAELAAKQAQENLDLANGRYAAGVGSPIEVSDAFATYVAAKASYTNALYNYRIDQAVIEKAMGMR